RIRSVRPACRPGRCADWASAGWRRSKARRGPPWGSWVPPDSSGQNRTDAGRLQHFAAQSRIRQQAREKRMKDRIGFIGLGSMGSGMAANLLAKGWPLTVWAHRSRDALLRLVADGAQEAKTPRALAEASDIVVLCVTGSPQVE